MLYQQVCGGCQQQTITVAQWSEQWERLAKKGKSPKQQEAISNALHNHILPLLGHVPLTQVSYVDAEIVMAAAADYSYSLRSKILKTMRSLFASARKNHLIIENPCLDLKAGKDDTQERAALTQQQQTVLEAAVSGTRAETFVLIGLYTGLRRSEILALQWDSVNLDSETPSLTVRRSVHWEHNKPIITETLKTRAAVRTIPLPSRLATYLRQQSRNGDYVIGGEIAYTLSQYQSMWRIIRRRTVNDFSEIGTTARNSRIIKTIDFRVTSHQLRHTYITRLILGGANIKHVQYLAGHSNVQTTLAIYTHLTDKNPSALAKSVNAVFGC